MDKIDELIGRALTDEDRKLLADPTEPGYLTQAFGLFRGPQSAIVWLLNIVAGAAFVAAMYAAWRMFESHDALLAVKYGVGAMFLFQVTSLCKGFMGNRLESNRVLREVKRIELQVSLMRGRAPSA